MSAAAADVELRCRAILFDCDGVLVDSTQSGEEAWSAWAGELNLETAAVVAGIHGVRSSDTVRIYLPAPQQENGLRRIEELELRTVSSTRAIPGASSLLAAVISRSAIVTSASPVLLQARLNAARLPSPNVVVTGRDVEHGKPDPEPYLRAAELLGVPISECVVVEDSSAGVASALAAEAGGVLGIGPAALQAGADVAVADLTGVRWTGHSLRCSASSLIGPRAPKPSKPFRKHPYG